MELVNGGQLRDLIDERKRNKIWFTEEEIAVIMKAILSAVYYFHSQNIVHRDLKPGWVLFN